MIRALIVDDEPLSRQAVRQMCARHSDVTLVAECRNGIEAAEVMRHSAVDVVFLDVRMPGLTGLELARRRHGGQLGQLPLVVFVTAYDQYALPAFDSAAIDYLTKPLNPARFETAMARVRQQLALLKQTSAPASGPDFVRGLVARVRGGDVVLPVESIEYIAADDVYAAVHLRAGVYLVRQSLDLLEQRLDPSRFARVHRSFIVQIDCITSIQRRRHGEKSLTLRSGAKVPVSRRRCDAIRRLSADAR